MARFYKTRIEMRKMTIDEVPERWREETRKLLAKIDASQVSCTAYEENED